MCDNWKDIIYLPENYKKIVNLYFKDRSGKFIIKNNVLEVDIDGWGIDYFYIDDSIDDCIDDCMDDSIDDSIDNSIDNCIEINNNKIYINEIKNNKIISKKDKLYYNILHNNFTKIYSIALLIQIGNWNVFKKMEEFIDNFKNINTNIYFFMIDEYSNDENVNYLKYKYKSCVIASCENRGMDIGPFLLNLHYIKYKNYNHEYIFKIHTKTCDRFRNETLDKLMKNHDTIINNIIPSIIDGIIICKLYFLI